MTGLPISRLRLMVQALVGLILFLAAPHLEAATLSAYAPKDELGPKWDELGWIDDTAFPWVYSYTYNNWFYVYDGVNADVEGGGYWLFYFTPDSNAYGWGYVLPGHGWWCYTLDNTVYWLRFGQGLPADGRMLRVSLMIDDGPTENTARLLAILAEKGVKANFDLIGVNCEARPDDTLAIWHAGHTINNHSYRHEWPSKVSDAELVNEVVKCNEAVESITGTTPVWYWTPYGDFDLRLVGILRDADLSVCFGGNTIVSSEDYLETTTAAAIKANIVDHVRDGTLLLFHEWRDETIEQMPSIIDELRAKGCVFILYTDMDAYLRSR